MTAFLKKAGPDLKSQIYRLSHHGALHANPENFLSFIKAEYVFSSSGYRYGHPRCEIYDYYKNRLPNILPSHPYTCFNVVSGKYVPLNINIKKPMLVTSLFREKSPGQWVKSYYIVEFSISGCGHVDVKFTHIGDE
uniref:Uncharacterized protein n=1 Tax=Amphimedon queenslandica TaxID=400682 RepID=A0A1X7UZ13_AMPQE